MRKRLLGLGIFLGLVFGALSISTALADGPLNNSLLNVNTTNGVNANVGGNNGVDVSVTSNDSSVSNPDGGTNVDVKVGVNDPVAHTSDPTGTATETRPRRRHPRLRRLQMAVSLAAW